MMDFIVVPLTTGIVFAAIYGLFELFVRRKERLAIIEKIGDNWMLLRSRENWDCRVIKETISLSVL